MSNKELPCVWCQPVPKDEVTTDSHGICDSHFEAEMVKMELRHKQAGVILPQVLYEGIKHAA